MSTESAAFTDGDLIELFGEFVAIDRRALLERLEQLQQSLRHAE
jgi:hypothetical protein